MYSPAVKSLREFGFDGRTALAHVIEQSQYGSVVQAVASLTAFTHPQTVAQTGNRNVFRVVRLRQMSERGTFAEVAGCDGRVMLDDNRAPAVAFEWAHGIRERPDVQVNHVWQLSRDVSAYTALPNLCLTPSFLAKLTDTDPTIRNLLRYRAYELFQYWPDATSPPTKPTDYARLTWAEPMPAVANLEQTYRNAMRAKRKDRVVTCARELGWLYSDFRPDRML